MIRYGIGLTVLYLIATPVFAQNGTSQSGAVDQNIEIMSQLLKDKVNELAAKSAHANTCPSMKNVYSNLEWEYHRFDNLYLTDVASPNSTVQGHYIEGAGAVFVLNARSDLAWRNRESKPVADQPAVDPWETMRPREFRVRQFA